jgi:hypothetical protein
MKLAVSLMNMGLMIDLVGAAILFALGHFIRHASGVDAIGFWLRAQQSSYWSSSCDVDGSTADLLNCVR